MSSNYKQSKASKMVLTITPNQIYVIAAVVGMLMVVAFLLNVFSSSFNRKSFNVNGSFESKYAAILDSLSQSENINDVLSIETMALKLLTREEIIDPKNQAEMNHLDASFRYYLIKFNGTVEHELKFSTHLPTASLKTI